MNEKINLLLENYVQAHQQIVDAIKEFPVDMWKFKPSENRWSIHEILIHIADSEVNSFSRCRKIIAENGGLIVAYDQDKWANSMFYHEQNTSNAIELFRLLRKMTYEMLIKLPDDAWHNFAEHSTDGKLNLTKWLEIYERHIPGHIEQMNKVYKDWKALND